MKELFKGSAVAALLVAACLPARAAQVYSNDFSSNQNGFVGGSIETSPSGEMYLANFQQSTTTLTISGLAPNSSISVGFTLDVINSLDGGLNPPFGGGTGDYFKVSINGANVFSNTFSNFGNGETQTYPVVGSAPGTGAAGTNTLGTVPCCGGQLYGDTIYDLSLNGSADGSGVATIVFNDDSNEAYSNEHYGIDNVVVDGTLASVTSTPLPAALPLVASGLGALGAFGWHRKRKARRVAA
jgi:hypothetical protein